MDNNSQQNSCGRVSDAGQGVSKLGIRWCIKGLKEVLDGHNACVLLQEPDSLGRSNNGVNDKVGDDIPSTEIHEGEHISYRGDNEVIAANTSSSKLSSHVSHENTVTAALIPSVGTDTAAMTKTLGPALTTMTPLAFDVTAANTPSSIEVATMINLSSGIHEPESIPNCDKVPTTEVQHFDLNLPARRSANERKARMNEFMVKFDSEDECISGMDVIAPTLSGDAFVEFQGMKIPSELVDPLVKFSKNLCEGNVLSLVNKGYTLQKKREMIIELGKLLFSMEIHRVQDEETFLIWRDVCRDFAQAGLNIDFVMDSLKKAARHYFGCMMRLEGSSNQCAKFHELQKEILQTKKKLALLEGELNETRNGLGLDLCDNPKSVLESSWTNDSCAALYLYKKV